MVASGDEDDGDYEDWDRKGKDKGKDKKGYFDCGHSKEKLIAIEKVVKVPKVTVIEHEPKKKKKRGRKKYNYY